MSAATFPDAPAVVPPGSTIGILGGGQLGRMLAVAAAQLGYLCHVYAPEAESPAAEVSHGFTQAAYEDGAALSRFAASCDVVTYEFENVPVAALDALPAGTLLRPGARALEVAQSRVDEKRFVAALGGRVAPFGFATREAEVDAALKASGVPAIIKTNRLGYDGKGQARVMPGDDPAEAWRRAGAQPSIVEGFVTFFAEFSVILARRADGTVAFWDSAVNVHQDGILATSRVPAPAEVLAQVPEARALAQRVAEALDYVGVLTLEFFACADGPVFNEMAPRVHNSGHWTIEGATTSQFENHIRAICGLPLGGTGLAGASATMRNLIGDAADEWPAILADPANHLHLYGKGEARPGRKMGHVTRVHLDTPRPTE